MRKNMKIGAHKSKAVMRMKTKQNKTIKEFLQLGGHSP